MSRSTITSKGQTTIPLDVRKFLDLKTGDKIEFIIEDGYVLLAPLTVEASELKGMLQKPKKKVTVEDMNKAIQKRGAKCKD